MKKMWTLAVVLMAILFLTGGYVKADENLSAPDDKTNQKLKQKLKNEKEELSAIPKIKKPVILGPDGKILPNGKPMPNTNGAGGTDVPSQNTGVPSQNKGGSPSNDYYNDGGYSSSQGSGGSQGNQPGSPQYFDNSQNSDFNSSGGTLPQIQNPLNKNESGYQQGQSVQGDRPWYEKIDPPPANFNSNNNPNNSNGNNFNAPPVNSNNNNNFNNGNNNDFK